MTTCLTVFDKPSVFLNPGWWIVCDDDAHGQAVAYARTPELARLIAAAPRMLAVLERLDGELSHAEDCCQREHGANECSCYVAEIAAAIAKATGTSS